jgi:hypothetical protein
MEGEIKDMSLFLINKPGKIEEDQYSELKKRVISENLIVLFNI